MNNQSQFKCIIPLSMTYIGVMTFSELFVNKFVSMPLGYTTAATFIFPIWFILNDIISEVYGCKICWRMIWLGFTILLIFNFISFGLAKLPPPTSSWHNQTAYNFIFNPLVRIELSTFFAFMISGFINIRLLTKWKALMSGKYFWLRSIGSSGIAEAIYSVANVWVVFIGLIPSSKIPIIIFWSFVLKIIYTIILAYPASILVQLIKKIDGIDVYDYEPYFNPFKKIAPIANFSFESQGNKFT